MGDRKTIMITIKKRKEYVGNIPFDLWGNQLHYAESGQHELTTQNFRNNMVCIEKYDSNTRLRNMVDLFFQDKQELQYNQFSDPQYHRYDHSKTGPKDIIGTITSCAEIPNHQFTDTLKYKHYSRGRSAAYFIFERTDGRTVSVFLTDFESIIRKMSNGQITDTFTFCKRGSNFGCKLIG
jgi:hypothetical protein